MALPVCEPHGSSITARAEPSAGHTIGSTFNPSEQSGGFLFLAIAGAFPHSETPVCWPYSAFHALTELRPLSPNFVVIAGLVPAIHLAASMDHRDKPGGDDGEGAAAKLV